MADKIVPYDATKDAKAAAAKSDGISPLQSEVLGIKDRSGNSSGVSEHDMRDLQLEAWQRTKPPSRLSGSAMPFRGEGTNVSVVDPEYGSFLTVTDNGDAQFLSSKAEPVHIAGKDGRSVGLDYDTSIRGQDGRPIVTNARVYEPDGTQFNFKRVGGTEQWKDSRTGEFRELEVKRALGTDPTTTAEIMIKDVKDAKNNLFFAPHAHEPRLTGEMSTADLLAKAKGDLAFTKFESYPHSLEAGGLAQLRTDFSAYVARDLGSFKHLTETENKSFLEKAEELGSFAMKEHGGKIGLGLAAAAGLAIAGNYLLGRHEKSDSHPQSLGDGTGLANSLGKQLYGLHLTSQRLKELEEPLYKGFDKELLEKPISKALEQ